MLWMSFPSLIYADFSYSIIVSREMKTIFMIIGSHVDKSPRGLSFNLY